MTTRLYVGNVSYQATERELHDLFAAHVGVDKCEILKDKFSGSSRGFAFVTLISADDAGRAIEALNGAELCGRNIRVEEARPRPDGDRGSSRNGHSRNGRGRDRGDRW